MNKDYRFGFVGLGSIAKRHIRNLKAVTAERGHSCHVDVYRSGKGADIPEELEQLIDHVYYDADGIPEAYDAVFVTNPTSLHMDAIRKFREHAKAFFIEKPVFHSSSVSPEGLELGDKICYVACPLRYTGAIRYLKEHLDPKEILSMRVVSASYLPDWRPGTDYRKTYSAQKALGGGVSIDLIHEWDYITYLIGMPKQVTSIIRTVSDLELDSDDIAVYLADYGSCIAELHLDYFTRIPIRRIEITTNDVYLEADLIRQTIRRSDTEEEISFESERDAFQKKELEFFLDVLEGKKQNTNDIRHAVDVLKIAEGKEL